MMIRMALVIGLMVVTIGGCKTARIKPVDPVPMATGSAEETREVIQKALMRRGWAIGKEEPGAIYAMLSNSAYTAVILLTYDAESVNISYSDSTNLKYRKNRKGREYIHKNYNKWIKRLAGDIRMLGRSVKQST